MIENIFRTERQFKASIILLYSSSHTMTKVSQFYTKPRESVSRMSLSASEISAIEMDLLLLEVDISMVLLYPNPVLISELLSIYCWV